MTIGHDEWLYPVDEDFYPVFDRGFQLPEKRTFELWDHDTRRGKTVWWLRSLEDKTRAYVHYIEKGSR